MWLVAPSIVYSSTMLWYIESFTKFGTDLFSLTCTYCIRIMLVFQISYFVWEAIKTTMTWLREYVAWVWWINTRSIAIKQTELELKSHSQNHSPPSLNFTHTIISKFYILQIQYFIDTIWTEPTQPRRHKQYAHRLYKKWHTMRECDWAFKPMMYSSLRWLAKFLYIFSISGMK